MFVEELEVLQRRQIVTVAALGTPQCTVPSTVEDGIISAAISILRTDGCFLGWSSSLSPACQARVAQTWDGPGINIRPCSSRVLMFDLLPGGISILDFVPVGVDDPT